MNQEWNNDTELFALMKKLLYTPVVGDILDGLGRFHQFLPSGVQPMKEEMLIAGRAMPVLMVDVYGHQEVPFGLLTQALDQLEPGEVYIGNGTPRCACWGEILTATSKKRGAVGAVVNGPHRDTPQVLSQNFPVFSTGRYAQDSSARMKVLDYRKPIEIEGVWIEPGDLIFADLDGVLVIPRALELEVITKSLEKARGEKRVRQEIEGGMSSTAAFQKYGIL